MSAEPGDLVSVIVPFYSHPEYLSQAIESVLGQTYERLELLIVDDGSPHDLTTVIEPYSSDSRIRAVRQENKGVAAARNTGIQLSRGAYLQFLDSDDWLASEKIACHVRALEAEPDVGLVFCPFHFAEGSNISEPMNPLWDPNWQAQDGYHFNTLWAANRTVLAGPLVRRNWIERANGFDTSNLTEDYELWLRLAALGCKMRSLPDALVYYRVNERGRSHDGQARTRRVATRKHILTLFPDLTAEATERAMETWTQSYFALDARLNDQWKETVQLNDRQKEADQRIAELEQALKCETEQSKSQQQRIAEAEAQNAVLENSLHQQAVHMTTLLDERDARLAYVEHHPSPRMMARGLREIVLPMQSRRYGWYRHLRGKG